MPLPEVTEADLLHHLPHAKNKEAILFVTALCGTCKLAERMLEIVLAASVQIDIRKLNINYAPRLRDAWKISSVPCLVIIQDGKPVQFEYAMQSVDHLYGLLK
ncbi:thiol reductase thioredoxin [Paenibacillus baekrokdamisoli]|uniref:Thiol reductase thioredoxin n=1 Tax=Paenibacillus baekrokdamisoli TaxID=1712516 RepID=A0A3G9IX89_9BACL|nr:thioredoxin family protein [Paenibacillus baekrokdamisoli]MBB3069893.1 thioredoxin-like negative regulator of GroEL [Paenibacillus baekrokdamisoli]BBH20755.1 thiol reductase thioredoxin [Paenibacillus baekrokdamisoli]